MTDSDSYVTGFLHSFDLNQWLLIDKGFTLSKAGPQLKWTGVGGKIQNRKLEKVDIIISDMPYGIKIEDEKPHIAMAREFFEETGYGVAAKRWHCFLIKEYKGCKIYCFACACSPDELQIVLRARTKLPEGDIKLHDYPSICFAPWEYTFDLRYIIPMIILEHQKGMFLQLDPEGANSEFKRTFGT